MTRPRVMLVALTSQWSYGFNAKAIAGELGDRFDFQLIYKGTRGAELRAWKPDLIVDFWWRGHTGRLVPRALHLKQVSSHRWGQDRYGSLDACTLVLKHLRCDGVLVPSRRLLRLHDAGAPNVMLAPKGFDPKLFGLDRRRTGELVIGWAGKASAPDKRLDLLRVAASQLLIAGGATARHRMRRFYNLLDVITIASDAEGDPLPLIEGMACGCFPVATDVGIVPELVKHGVNGLIVAQSVEAFADAFAWCRSNLEYVRAAGQRNAQLMLETRTWAHMAPSWGSAFDIALGRRVLDLSA